MRKVFVVLFIIIFGSNCSSRNRNENIELINDQLKAELESFIVSLPKDYLYRGEKVVTVNIIDEGNESYKVNFTNAFPITCSFYLGSMTLNSFEVAFFSNSNENPFVKQKTKPRCKYNEVTGFPEEARYAQRHYVYLNGLLKSL